MFDLDGVVTFTAGVHEAAWKALFDAFLAARKPAEGEDLRPFDADDYRCHVDGRPRQEGVRAFLDSRGIRLPEGTPADPPDRESVHALGRRKNELFRQRLAESGVEVDGEAVRLILELRAAGVRVGMASSSRNASEVLERAGLTELFEARVDGVVSERLELPGKPDPAIFLTCLEMLGLREPGRSLMVEDAGVGAAAGRAGGFGLVVGVDRGSREAALREHGAHWVVPGFAGVTAERVFREFGAHAAG